MESAASVIAVFGDADVVAADGAFSKVAFIVPLPEVRWVLLAYDACVKWCVDVDFDFAVEFALDVVDFVECCLVLFWCWGYVRHVFACSADGHKVVVDEHA